MGFFKDGELELVQSYSKEQLDNGGDNLDNLFDFTNKEGVVAKEITKEEFDSFNPKMKTGGETKTFHYGNMYLNIIFGMTQD